jgi:hypothetical protein
MQISTTQLSSSPGPLIGSFDKGLLDSIAGGQAATGAFAAVAKIMAALAAQADRIGQEVASQTGVTGPVPANQTAVAQYKAGPNLQATTAQSGAGTLNARLNITPTAGSTTVQDTLSKLANDSLPNSIVKAVDALFLFDPIGLLNAIVGAIEAFLGPIKIIFDGIASLFGSAASAAATSTAALASTPAPEGLAPVSDPTASTPEPDPVASGIVVTPVKRLGPSGHAIPPAHTGTHVSTEATTLSEPSDTSTTPEVSDVPVDTANQELPPTTDKPESKPEPPSAGGSQIGHHTGPQPSHGAHAPKTSRGSANRGGQSGQSPAGAPGTDDK